MPTFQSIGVHPALRSRLVTQSSLIPEASATERSISTNLTTTATTTAASSSTSSFAPGSYYQRVETPHTLLVRHPESLKLLEDPATGACRTIDRDEVVKLRQEVAEALISETRCGQYVDRVRRTLREEEESQAGGLATLSSSSPSPLRLVAHEHQSSARNENEYNNRIDVDDKHDERDELFKSSEEEQQECHRGQLEQAPAVPDDGFHIPGTLTVLELLTFDSLRQRRHRDEPGATRVVALSTGCPALDEILSLPREHFEVASVTTTTAAQRGLPVGGSAISAPEAGQIRIERGVPMGCVTQFFGPPASGKTQLALHVAAHRFQSVSHGDTGCRSNRTTNFPCWFLGPATFVQASSHAARLAKLSKIDPVVLNQTWFHPVSSIYQVLSALSTVEESLASVSSMSETLAIREGGRSLRSTLAGPLPALIILDSASTCCSCADPKSADSLRLLHRLAMVLKRISRQYLAAVIVTNGSISATNSKHPPGDPNTVYPALGRIWEQAVDIQVRVESHPRRHNVPHQAIRQAILVRHPTKFIPPEARPSATFGIDPNSGINEILEPSLAGTAWSSE